MAGVDEQPRLTAGAAMYTHDKTGAIVRTQKR